MSPKGNEVLYASPELGEKVSDYAEEHSTALPQALIDYHAKICATHEDAEMLSSTLQSQLNVFLARSIGAKRVLEIGVFVGFSAMVWSHAVGPDGDVVGLEYEPEFAQVAKDALSAQGIKNVEIITGDAAETLPKVDYTKPFDLVFIDADKTGYPNYLKQLLEHSQPGSAKRMLRPGSIIITDNVLQRTHVLADDVVAKLSPNKPSKRRGTSAQAVREFNDLCVTNPRLETFLVPLWDGASLVRLVD